MTALLLVFVAAGPSATRVLAQANACTSADALRDAGEIEAARAEYVNVIKNNADFDCAVAALKDINSIPTADVQAVCDVGDAFRDAGELEEARKTYVELLRIHPDASCATGGLSAINSPTPTSPPTPRPDACNRGDDLFDQGRLSAAKSAYRELSSGTTCADAGLTAIQTVQRLCRQGEAYLKLGRQDDALATFKTAAEKNAAANCVKRGLDNASPPRPLQWASDNLSEALSFLGFALLALFLLLMLGYFRWGRWILARIPFIKKFVKPKLLLPALDDTALKDSKVGAAMAAEIKRRLQHLRVEALRASQEPGSDGPDAEETFSYGLDVDNPNEEFADLVSGNSGLQSSLEKLSGLSDQTKLVGGLVSLVHTFLPTRTLNVTGTLHPPTKTGASVSMALESNSRTEAAVTLTGQEQSTDPVPSDYMRLAQPAAVWIQYVVTSVLRGHRVHAEEAEAQAYIRRGLDALSSRDYAEARRSFQRALELVPTNSAVKMNLAMAEARLQSDFDAAILLLAEALADRITADGE